MCKSVESTWAVGSARAIPHQWQGGWLCNAHRVSRLPDHPDTVNRSKMLIYHPALPQVELGMLSILNRIIHTRDKFGDELDDGERGEHVKWHGEASFGSSIPCWPTLENARFTPILMFTYLREPSCDYFGWRPHYLEFESNYTWLARTLFKNVG